MSKGRFTDLTGRTFERLYVLGRIAATREAWWSCVCDCGRYTRVTSHQLTSRVRPTRSCGCLRDESNRTVRDLTGMRVNMLTAVRLVDVSESGAFWLCRCDCGGEAIRSRAALVARNTRSCGCMRGSIARERAAREGMPRAITLAEKYREGLGR